MTMKDRSRSIFFLLKIDCFGTIRYFLLLSLFLYTIRGVGHNQHLAICEEFAHMDNRVFYHVVSPTLATGSAFIGITTLGEDENSNFVSKLIEIRDNNGNRLFRVIDMKQVCKRCERLGKETICHHMAGEIPYWQDEKRRGDIELMMQGKSDVWLREMRFVN